MKRRRPSDVLDADPFVAERLETLERLVTEHPDAPEARAARRLGVRCHFYLRRGLRPLSRRYLLADLRTVTRRLERNHHEQ